MLRRYRQWRKKKDGPAAYKRRYLAYLTSREWGIKRNAVIFRDESCVICGERDRKKFEVHHRRYNNLFNEGLTDLTTLCRQCHADNTEMLKRRGWKGR